MEHPIIYDKEGIVIKMKGPYNTLYWKGEEGGYRQISFVGNKDSSDYKELLQAYINMLILSIKKYLSKTT